MILLNYWMSPKCCPVGYSIKNKNMWKCQPKRVIQYNAQRRRGRNVSRINGLQIRSPDMARMRLRTPRVQQIKMKSNLDTRVTWIMSSRMHSINKFKFSLNMKNQLKIDHASTTVAISVKAKLLRCSKGLRRRGNRWKILSISYVSSHNS